MESYDNTAVTVSTRVKATGFTAVCSTPAVVSRVLVGSTGTGLFQFFTGVTGSASSGALIRANATAVNATINTAVLYNIAQVFASGFSINVGASADPDITIYWSPIQGV